MFKISIPLQNNVDKITSYDSSDLEHLFVSLEYWQRYIKEALVDKSSADRLQILHGASPEVVQNIRPLLLLQTICNVDRLVNLGLDIFTLGNALQKFLSEILHNSRAGEGKLIRYNVLKTLLDKISKILFPNLARDGKINFNNMTICSRVADLWIFSSAMYASCLCEKGGGFRELGRTAESSLTNLSMMMLRNSGSSMDLEILSRLFLT